MIFESYYFVFVSLFNILHCTYLTFCLLKNKYKQKCIPVTPRQPHPFHRHSAKITQLKFHQTTCVRSALCWTMLTRGWLVMMKIFNQPIVGLCMNKMQFMIINMLIFILNSKNYCKILRN